MRAPVVAALALAIVACGPAPAKEPPGGTGFFRFDLSEQVRTSGAMPRPAKGSVYGNVFLQEDVSISGPRDGAQQFQDVTVDGLDLTAGQPETSFTTGALPPGSYVFLGFLDTNGNGATSKDPDKGDLVTLPTTNKFEIASGQETKRKIVFDLIYN